MFLLLSTNAVATKIIKVSGLNRWGVSMFSSMPTNVDKKPQKTQMEGHQDILRRGREIDVT